MTIGFGRIWPPFEAVTSWPFLWPLRAL